MIGKKILITGAQGFIGTYLSEALGVMGAEIHSIDIKLKSGNSKYTFFEHIGDLCDKDFVSETIKNLEPDFVFHLAADKNRSDFIGDFYSSIQNNLIATLNLFYALTRLNLKPSKIIILGTAEEYGNNKFPFSENLKENPNNNYSFSKVCQTYLSATMYNLYKFPTIIIRPTVAYGPGQPEDMFIPALISSLLKGNEFEMTEGEQTRDFIYISDLIESLICIAKSDINEFSILNIGSGIQQSIKSIAGLVEKKLGCYNLIKIGKKNYKKSEIMRYGVSLEKLNKVIDWKPKVGIEEGINKTIHYFKKRKNV